MERLTSSPFILDVYGFCGQTAINEYADFIDGFQNFKTFAKQLVNKNDKDVLAMKLRISAMIAIAVQHIHEIDGADVASMVHNDINPMNIVITKGGIPKLNDFNVAEFLQWNQAKNETCGFEGRFHEPWWRSPEEMEMPALAKSAKNKSGKVEKLLNG
jgi:serine/threonine protein kinase